MYTHAVKLWLAAQLVVAAGVTAVADSDAISTADAVVGLGTNHPLVIQAIAPDGSRVAACQARRDTNADGEIAVYQGHRGELSGDAMEFFLLHPGNPEGERFDSLIRSILDCRASTSSGFACPSCYHQAVLLPLTRSSVARHMRT